MISNLSRTDWPAIHTCCRSCRIDKAMRWPGHTSGSMRNLTINGSCFLSFLLTGEVFISHYWHWSSKVKLALCLTKYHAIKTYGEMEVSLRVFLSSALHAASRPGRLILEEPAPGTHWIEGWVDPRAGLDEVAKSKIFLPLPRIEPLSSSK
jgi:hypothetical protein